jgi:hypothetical protein
MTMPVKLPARIRGFRSGIINEILDYLRALTPINSRTVKHEVTVDGMKTVTTGMGDLPPGDRNLEVTFQGASAFVNPGYIQIGGVISEVTTETEKALSGTPVYVYAQIPRADKTSLTLLTHNSRPTSDGTYFRFVLAEAVAVGSQYVRTLDRSGAIEIDTPTK